MLSETLNAPNSSAGPSTESGLRATNALPTRVAARSGRRGAAPGSSNMSPASSLFARRSAPSSILKSAEVPQP